MSKDAVASGSEDFRDRSMAAAISVALHLITIGWAWSLGGQVGRGESEIPGNSVGTGMEAGFLSPDEFRQRIETMPVLASAAESAESEKRSDDVPDAAPEPSADLPDSPESVDTDLSHARTATATEDSEVTTSKSVEAGLAQGGKNASDNDDDGLRAAYLAALRAAIRQHWNYQGPQQQCALTIKQSPGGAVQSAIAEECSLTSQDRRALEAAVLMAQPLPYAGFETAFTSETQLDASNF